jgi:hypothetical protein
MSREDFYRRNRLILVRNRIDMLAKLRLVRGPLYIMSLLERYKFERKLFIIDLEAG